MGRTKKEDDGFDIRTALLIPADAVQSFIQNGNEQVVGQFMLEYGAYALYGMKPERFGEVAPGMSRQEVGLVHLMKKCMLKTDKDKVAYKEKSEKMRENANKRHHPELYDAEQNNNLEHEQPAEPEPDPAPKKRTYTKRTSKKEEKKELTPEEIEIKAKNDKGEEIFFEAWERYDPTYKGISYKDIIERDASGHNKLLEKIVDIGRDDLLNAVDEYKADRESKGLIKKGSKNFFGDMEFLSYIGKPVVVNSKEDDDFDEFNTVD